MASFSCCSQGLWKIKIYITSTLAATPFNHGLPRWLSGKESACQCRRCGFSAWVRKILWRRKWQPTPVFLPEEYHGQGSLMGYSPWGCRVRYDWSDLAHTKSYCSSLRQWVFLPLAAFMNFSLFFNGFCNMFRYEICFVFIMFGGLLSFLNW